VNYSKNKSGTFLWTTVYIQQLERLHMLNNKRDRVLHL